MEQLYEMTTWELNGHISGHSADVRWLWMVKVVTLIRLEPISPKRLEIDARFQWTTRKWHMANHWSSDSERSRSWPQYIWIPLSHTMAGDTYLVTTELL